MEPIRFAAWRLARVLAAGTLCGALLLTLTCVWPNGCGRDCMIAEDRR